MKRWRQPVSCNDAPMYPEDANGGHDFKIVAHLSRERDTIKITRSSPSMILLNFIRHNCANIISVFEFWRLHDVNRTKNERQLIRRIGRSKRVCFRSAASHPICSKKLRQFWRSRKRTQYEILWPGGGTNCLRTILSEQKWNQRKYL